MTKINIGENDRIILKNSERRVVSSDAVGYVLARTGHSVELHEPFTHEEIVKLIDAGEMRIDRNWFEESRARARLMAGVDSLSNLKTEEQNLLLRREYYVSQFLAMEAADNKVTRTDPQIKKAIIDIEVSRLTDGTRCDVWIKDKRPPSPRTLRRWLKHYEDGQRNVIALRTRYRHSGNPISNIDPEVHSLLTKYAIAYCHESRPPISLLHGRLLSELATVNLQRDADGLPRLTAPAKATLQRRIQKLNQFEVHASRHGISSARARFAVVGNGLDVTRPLQHVQIDTWTIQLHTIVNDLGLDQQLTAEDRKRLKKERLKFCVVFDVATRCVLGFRISRLDDAQNAIAALAMSVSDKSAIAKSAGCKSDWMQRGPGSCYSPDAGSPFIDSGFRGTIACLGSVYENAPAGLSHMRGHIERSLGTFHTMLMPNFTGRSFSNVIEKGDYEADDRISILSKQLPMIFTRFIVDIYHHTPHEGLCGETPYNAWVRLTALYGTAPCPNIHERRDIFGVPLKRTLHTRGIRVGGNYYQSEEIQEWRRQVGDTDLDVRFDTSDIGHISAWFDGRWNVVPAVRSSLRGVDFNTWKDAVADLRRRHAAGARVYEHIVHDAIRAISAIAEDAVCRTAISGTRPTAKELDLEEDRLTLGFDIVSDDIAEEKHPDDILGTSFPGPAGQPEATPILGDSPDAAYRPELED
ncbi:putative transposase [Rhodopseudomonas faecalis]|uniref:Putative transposase n=1 Tax=Rhodopseudomonas faecalis TaxID=99655 RepID=A0A318TDB7_9BRAD|nr:Mu transposase C-terminal domain-containing protein [Rhodopseudomonas faecalis]PYF01820.1 putative transposase [Rhodopseudomonas faecalis]